MSLRQLHRRRRRRVIPKSAKLALRLQQLGRELVAGRLDYVEQQARLLLLDDGENPYAYNLLGLVAQRRREPLLATELYEQGLKCHPGNMVLRANYGHCLTDLGRHHQAVEQYQHALSTDPQQSQRTGLLNSLGRSYHLIGESERGEHYLQQALLLSPDNPRVLTNLAMLKRDCGDLSAAEQCCEQAIATDPNYGEPHFTLATLLLLRGDYLRGWAEYEYRWQLQGISAYRSNKPSWDGQESLAGKTIALPTEQGLGDTIQFARYVGWLRSQGAEVVMTARSPLVRFMSGWPGLKSVVPNGQGLRFDTFLPLMSAARHHGTTVETVPALPAPTEFRLPARPTISEFVRQNSQGTRLRIGISWTGSPTNLGNIRRSCRLNDFAALAQIPSVQLFNLNPGEHTRTALRGCQFPLVDLTPYLSDFADTAAAVQELDLIVTIDTSLAHLAASLSRPTWVLLSPVPDWRWLLQRVDSPWYPSVKLFRQSSDHPNAWGPVFERVRDSLRALLRTRA